jgi:hypothetical protein
VRTDHARVEVHVRPGQAELIALPKACEDGEGDLRPIVVAECRGRARLLVVGEEAYALVVLAREELALDRGRPVEAFLVDGLVEGAPHEGQIAVHAAQVV